MRKGCETMPGAKLIDGKKMADAILEKVRGEVLHMMPPPCLAIVLVGDDPASVLYTKKKAEACGKVGIVSKNINMPASATQEQVIAKVDALNNDRSVNAILVQLPLPKGIGEDAVVGRIVPEKDVDGFHPENLGKVALNMGGIVSCTPKGVIRMLKESGVSLAGKRAAVMGRSRMVGKPLAYLLTNEDCTVTLCHSKTKDVSAITREADIVCVAVGKPHALTGDMVKKGAIVIDIGTNKVGEMLVGDVDFESVKKKCSLITPVPGGVGPMTIAMLMENTVLCCKKPKEAQGNA